MTKVDRIPAPQRVTFDPESHALTINIGATCLQLVRFNFHLKFSFNFNSCHFNSLEKFKPSVVKMFITLCQNILV